MVLALLGITSNKRSKQLLPMSVIRYLHLEFDHEFLKSLNMKTRTDD